MDNKDGDNGTCGAETVVSLRADTTARRKEGAHPTWISWVRNVVTPMKSEADAGSVSQPQGWLNSSGGKGRSQKRKPPRRKTREIHNPADRAIPALKSG